MSVQSQIDRVSGEVATQAYLIDLILAALQGNVVDSNTTSVLGEAILGEMILGE